MISIAQDIPECFPILTDRDSVAVTLLYSEGKVCIFGKAPEGTEEIAAVLISTSRSEMEVGVREKFLLFWITGKRYIIENMPSIYQSASGGVCPGAGDCQEIKYGYSSLYSKWNYRRLNGKTDADDDKLLFDGFVRLKEKQGLYKYEPNSIVLKENGLFHYKFTITDDAPEGKYVIRVRAYKGDGLCGLSEQTIEIARKGIVRNMSLMAKGYPLAYGIIAVLTAGITGIVVSIAFKSGEE